MHYQAQGHYARAEPLFLRALSISEKALRPDDRAVAATLNNLGELYRTQGRYAEAEPYLKRSLEVGEKTFGPEHPNVASTLNVLADLYVNQSHYSEAELLLQRALAIRENALGPEHPEIASSLTQVCHRRKYLLQEQWVARCKKREWHYMRVMSVKSPVFSPRPAWHPGPMPCRFSAAPAPAHCSCARAGFARHADESSWWCAAEW